jgi:hypothetical protein
MVEGYMGWLRNCEDITAAAGTAQYRLSPIDGDGTGRTSYASVVVG